MRKADFEARIRKIEIVNRVFHDSFVQTMRVVLDEVELINENLLEIRQFRPNEVVHVEITPAQLGLADLAVGTGGQSSTGMGAAVAASGREELAGLVEEGEEDPGGSPGWAPVLVRW